MAHHSKAFTTAPATGTVPTAAQFLTLDLNGYSAIDGDAGGTWAPAAVILIGGQGMHVSGPFAADQPTLTAPIVSAPPTYVSPIAKNRAVPCTPLPGSFSGGTQMLPTGTGAATSVSNTWSTASLPGTEFPGFYTTAAQTASSAFSAAYVVPLDPFLIDGATLTQAYLTGVISSSHTAVPAVKPAFGIFRFQVLGTDQTTNFKGGTLPSANRLLSTASAPYSPSAPTLASYLSNPVICNFFPDQNNVIDLSNWTYIAVIWDEGGANALSGNAYNHIVLEHTVPGMRV